MNPNVISLYCHRCHKHYDVDKDELTYCATPDLLYNHDLGRYEFLNECFFKALRANKKTLENKKKEDLLQS